MATIEENGCEEGDVMSWGCAMVETCGSLRHGPCCNE
jgi:hypothetical protein